MPKWILEKPIRLFWLGAGFAGGLWLLWAIFGPAVAERLAAEDMATPGQWGDTFGALNALFGAFGFAAIFATLVAQQGELRDQKERSEQAERERHVERFESSLMELLRLMRELRKEIQFKHSEAYNSQPDADRSALFSKERLL